MQTNLALKGIIGIKAMSGIAETIANVGDYKLYKVKSSGTSLGDDANQLEEYIGNIHLKMD